MTTVMQPPPRYWVMSLIAAAFGLLTIKSGAAALFGDETARSAAGNYVPFVLWFNFLAGFAYVIASVGLWNARSWSAWLAIAIAAATALVFVAFGVHIAGDGTYEMRTVMAMGLRTLVWAVIAAMVWKVAIPSQQ